MPRREKPFKVGLYRTGGLSARIENRGQMVRHILSLKDRHLRGSGWGFPKVNVKKLLKIRRI